MNTTTPEPRNQEAMNKIAILAALRRDIETLKRDRDRRRARRFKQYARERGVNPYANPCGLVQS